MGGVFGGPVSRLDGRLVGLSILVEYIKYSNHRNSGVLWIEFYFKLVIASN